MRKRLMIFSLVLCFTLAAGYLPADSQFKKAPASKEFLDYIHSHVRPNMFTEDGHPLGYLPGPVDLSRIKGVVDQRVINTYDASFDLRTQGKLSAVKDQASCGACWAFATMASLESYLLPGEALNFSEQDLNANHGFDYAECAGGNSWMSQAYLARWSGPLSESDVPYPYSPDGAGYTPLKHVQQMIWLPARASYTDNDTIKYFLTTYGALQFSYYHDNSFYNSTYKSYYKNTSSSGTNHAVAIVGWNDNYPAANFNTAAPGNGAFICRNSWGTSWGESGYFYMSYYDTSARNFVSWNNAESNSNYDAVYQYDTYGWVTDWGCNATEGWGANVFTASEDQQLKAVGFITNDVNTNYTIYVYTGVTAGAPRSGTLAATKSGTNTYTGYYTVPLDSAVDIASGELFSVVIKFVTTSYGYPVPADQYWAGYSSASTSAAGESFISCDGTTWYDMETIDPGNGNNFVIKAFADADAPPPTLKLNSPNGWEHWGLGTNQTITWTAENYTGTVRLVLFKGGSRWGNIATGVDAAAGSYAWSAGSVYDNTMPAAGTDFRIYLRSQDNTIVDASDLRFALNTPAAQLELLTPSGVELERGSTYDITWNANGYAGTVRLVLFNKAAKIGQIVANIPASQGTYSWTVGEHSGGSTAPLGDNYSIRLLAGDGSQEDYNDLPFSIITSLYGKRHVLPCPGPPMRGARTVLLRL